MSESSLPLLQSPLHEVHIALGAKMADFGGWEMPIEYPASIGGGVLAEHQAVRNAVGLFDVSHLGKALVVGAGARAFINSCFTNDLDRIAAGEAQYTLCCDESGGVVDDLIQYLRSDEEVFLIPNASNTTEVVRRLQAAVPAGITVTNHHLDFAVIAVQGPRSVDVMKDLGLPHELEYMAFVDTTWSAPSGESISLIVCRTGYTGEYGFELLPSSDGALTLWKALSESAAKHGGRPCGLGARDTLRTEMGYPLHGHELSLEISPVQASANWAVGWKKENFWGRSALLVQREAGAKRVLRAITSLDRGIPRAGMELKSPSGDVVGVLTSGTFSPTLKVGIGLALVDANFAVGDHLSLDVRGRVSEVVITKFPLVESHVRS
ncbi:MAG: glycine cleavage system aminomethyltransferase GcvT [Actinomycetes bacterium]